MGVDSIGAESKVMTDWLLDMVETTTNETAAIAVFVAWRWLLNF